MNEASPFWANERATLYLGDALSVLSSLPSESVDCIITSPPYYGQRDYEVADQIGLEKTPFLFVERLVKVFRQSRRVLKQSGSLWVNIGDTYWSGKGRPTERDGKNPHRRFERPQDRTISHPVCRPKQLLLIPQRFAIAMQEDGWIVRNDVVLWKTNPTPDPVSDRLATAHEYFYFFVKKAHGYYFDRQAIKLPCADAKSTKNMGNVWSITNRPTFKKHIAPFQENLLQVPVRACLPQQGVLLDPFCGSATSLKVALETVEGCRGIGIDISSPFLDEARQILETSVFQTDIEAVVSL